MININVRSVFLLGHSMLCLSALFVLLSTAMRYAMHQLCLQLQFEMFVPHSTPAGCMKCTGGAGRAQGLYLWVTSVLFQYVN